MGPGHLLAIQFYSKHKGPFPHLETLYILEMRVHGCTGGCSSET